MTDTAQACGNCWYRKPYFDLYTESYLNGEKQPCTWQGDAPFYMLALNRWVREDEGKDCIAWHPK